MRKAAHSNAMKRDMFLREDCLVTKGRDGIKVHQRGEERQRVGLIEGWGAGHANPKPVGAQNQRYEAPSIAGRTVGSPTYTHCLEEVGFPPLGTLVVLFDRSSKTSSGSQRGMSSGG